MKLGCTVAQTVNKLDGTPHLINKFKKKEETNNLLIKSPLPNPGLLLLPSHSLILRSILKPQPILEHDKMMMWKINVTLKFETGEW